ncbi:MAG: hypothetical protein ACI35R_15600 [Bacillus sp. (in: firmicutes)]
MIVSFLQRVQEGWAGSRSFTGQEGRRLCICRPSLMVGKKSCPK